MIRRIALILRDPRGASAAEFAILLPLALLFLFGIIDVGRYVWTINQLEKAAQMGVRYAVATDIVPQGLNTYDFADACATPLVEGDRICREALGAISCSVEEGQSANSVQCECAGGNCNSGMIGTESANAFENIVKRMHFIQNEIVADNVSVTYAGSGIGYLGDPTRDAAGHPLSDVSPIVTVAISDMEMRSMTFFGAGLRLPEIKSSLTQEDGAGYLAY